MLRLLNRPQPATPCKTDNYTARGFVNDPFMKKCSKAWDIGYHWLSDKSALDNFSFIRIKEETSMLIAIQNIMLLLIIIILGTPIC